MQSNLEELEQALGHRFTDRALLVRALTHSSSANEAQPGATPELPMAQDNERLEFLATASSAGWSANGCSSVIAISTKASFRSSRITW